MSAKSPDKRSKRTTAPRGRGSRNTDEFEPGLTDIEGFSHLIVIWEFDRSEGFSLVGKPPTDDRPHGVFATRSPRRPNPIGLTVVELLSRDGGILRIRGIDMLDGAPILDIKLSLKCTLGRLRRGWLAEAEARASAKPEAESRALVIAALQGERESPMRSADALPSGHQKTFRKVRLMRAAPVS
jgi:tRNA (Thr-GGU) A37 N-methylase